MLFMQTNERAVKVACTVEGNAQGRGDEADKVADHAAAEGEENGITRTALVEHEILDRGLALAALARLAGRDHVGEETDVILALEGGRELGLERGEKVRADVVVGDEDVG
jgi:hypothetical protein